ncbi:IS200/IS605 family transposase [Salmonirosea aquatica]|uniref:IS200/IS605 family transposase n=1 Tax=Salmonirosea aquatica TaxID=2654236 RepID=A0A7C9FPY4_9BACT|nr:IS200/IS605 family transposase [Cytophagaceae bacterium SJW1-29]
MPKPDTFSQMYIHVVFAVKGRANVIRETHREQVQRYITGIVQNRKAKVLAIYCRPDHIHILISINPTTLAADLVRDIKTNSTIFIKEQGIARNFAWQEGYGIFTVSHSQKDTVYHYIINQAEHHRQRSFRDEYLALLQKNEIEFDEKYTFEWYEHAE